MSERLGFGERSKRCEGWNWMCEGSAKGKILARLNRADMTSVWWSVRLQGYYLRLYMVVVAHEQAQLLKLAQRATSKRLLCHRPTWILYRSAPRRAGLLLVALRVREIVAQVAMVYGNHLILRSRRCRLTRGASGSCAVQLCIDRVRRGGSGEAWLCASETQPSIAAERGCLQLQLRSS